MKSIKPQPGPQEQFLSSSADIVIYGGAAGGGKMLSIDTPIPTPEGWVCMGDIKKGDKVFSETGEICTVLIAHQIITPANTYKLTFDDGSEIIACGDHQWRTYTATELSQLTRRTDEFRENRRKQRLSRKSGNKSSLFSDTISKQNKDRAISMCKDAPSGGIRTTEEICNTLICRGRRNHAIPVTRPLIIQDADLLVDPYILGAWLGDGTSTAGSITTADQEIVYEFDMCGYVMTEYTSKYTWGVRGLITQLRTLGLVNNKHIPPHYLRSSISQRLALLQGLMDTDGCVKSSGSVEFTSTNYELAHGVAELAISLGSKAIVKTGRATLYGKDCGAKYRVVWSPDYPVFRLQRKLCGQKIHNHRRTTQFRYITKCEKTHPVPMRCITVDSASHLYLCGKGMIPTHNTYALLLEALRHIHMKGFGAVIFRRTSPQIRNEGGLWDTSEDIYSLAGGVPKQSVLKWEFEAGTTIKFAHIEHEKNKLDYQGAQIPLIEFDELTHFSQSQFFYMLSRNRSTCGVKPYVRATTNPDADSWVAKFISWWIDDDGYPISNRSGVIRWFARINDEIIWGDSPEEITDITPSAVPKSFTFINAKLEDNVILELLDPGYRANLMALPLVERERLLGGNWKVRPAAGNYFRREWFEVVEYAPSGRSLRNWDLAATVPSTENPDPDWTAGIKLVERGGITYIVDLRHDRVGPAGVDKLVKNTATQDGIETDITIEQEPGSSGKITIAHYARLLKGYKFHGTPSSKDKETRAGGASSASENGLIKIVRADWNDVLLNELHGFPDAKHDDIVDALSGAFNEMAGIPKGDYSEQVVTNTNTRKIPGLGIRSKGIPGL